MPAGVVKSWHTGWGIITPTDGGEEVFVHRTEIRSPVGRHRLAPFERVSYQVVETERGPAARCVRVWEG